jgi:protein-tyrosine phosphatase
VSPVHAAGPPAVFEILYVCVGNICRSPMAERLTRYEIQARLGPYAGWFHVGSAGTHGLVGEEMHPYSAEVLRASGVDPSDFRARRLAPELLRPAQLILAATEVERDQVVRMFPRALRRTFTIKEFARLASATPPEPGLVDWPGSAEPGHELTERARTVVARTLAMRGRLPYVDPRIDDINDPIQGTPDAFYECGMAIASAVGTAVAVLLGVDPPPSAHPSADEEAHADEYAPAWPDGQPTPY